jgi:predicted NUDIX family NTP pyrophosphohydrolase
MSKTSAGILLYRRHAGELQVLLVHPGGPFWAKKDEGAWSIPKGEVVEGEEPLQTAKREFEEELGVKAARDFMELSPIKQKGGKTVYAWALEGDLDVSAVKSNTFAMEWPPKSGQRVEFPEVDRAEFFDVGVAVEKVNGGQVGLIKELEKLLTR